MSHLNLPNFFDTRGYLGNISGYSVSAADLPIARSALMSDVNSFFINGIISFSSAINSLNNSNFSWSFIQSYYSLFFFARAFNGINDYAIVYKDRTPYSIKIQPTESFSKSSGNSHDVVLKQFNDTFASDILNSTSIDGMKPIEWFKNNRNQVNYSSNPFSDPKPPLDLFDYKGELRKWIATYFGDTTHSYTFDPSHCYLAYPIQVFIRLYEYFLDNNIQLGYEDEKYDFLKKNLSDGKGPMTFILSKISEII